jgi:hypothetical protein
MCPVDDFRRRHRLQIKQGKPEGRRHERGLQVHRQQDAEPYRVVSEFDHDGGQHRYMDKGDFDEIQEKADDEDQPHDNGQHHVVAVFIGQGS